MYSYYMKILNTNIVTRKIVVILIMILKFHLVHYGPKTDVKGKPLKIIKELV